MKKIRFFCLMALLAPISSFAHPGDHHEHNFMTILVHFFSQPDHLLVLMLVCALLWCVLFGSRTAFVRKALSFAQKLIKRAP